MTSLKEIARSQEVSQKYLEHLFSALQVAGLVRSARGPRGGYTLARPAGEITVREIYEVLEGLDDFAPCTSGPEVCNRYDICVTHELWERMHRRRCACSTNDHRRPARAAHETGGIGGCTTSGRDATTRDEECSRWVGSLPTYRDDVGRTPPVRLNRVTAAPAPRWWSDGIVQPLWSVRTASPSHINAAEAGAGQCRHDHHRLTSGNTGIGLSFAPAGISSSCDARNDEHERRQSSRRWEPNVLTPGGRACLAPSARELRTEIDSFIPQQFKNPANSLLQCEMTAEDLNDTDGRVDIVVAYVGWGTITGIGRPCRGRAWLVAGASRRAVPGGRLAAQDQGRRWFVPDVPTHEPRRGHSGR